MICLKVNSQNVEPERRNEVIKMANKPIEDFFGIDPSTTFENKDGLTFENDTGDLVAGDIVPTNASPQDIMPYRETLDDEEKAIADQLHDIHQKAMDVFQMQTEMVEVVDPKYAARNAEVAAQYLNTALQATALRAKIKAEQNRQRLNNTVGAIVNGGTVTQNIVVADRDEMLRAIKAKKNDVLDPT